MSVEIIDDDRAERRLRREIAKAQRAAITVGIHGRETGRDDGALTNAQLGAYHEFGTRTIPARPFLGGTFDNRRGQIGETVDWAGTAILDGRADTEQALGIAAQRMASEVQQYMADGIDPPLGESAIKERERRLGGKTADNNRFGGDKPLILSGQLRQSIAGKVAMTGGGEK